MNLVEISEKDAFAQTSEELVFCAALSFEERCVSVCELLTRNGVYPETSVLYSYDTRAEPLEETADSRSRHLAVIEELLKDRSRTEKRAISNPYSTTALRKEVESILASIGSRRLIVDFTCMTRVHVLAWATVLGSRELDLRLVFCYSEPESYGLHREERPGWRDTLLIPIGRPWALRREGHSRGVVLAGHDGERLSAALQELEPGTGVFVYSMTGNRPDLMQRAKEANQAVSERLLSLRLPRTPKTERTRTDYWRRAVVGLTNFKELEVLLLDQVHEAESDEGPVILFPFGPKPLALSAALTLASDKRVGAWAVYPIPDRYSLDYSQGKAALHWMILQ